MIKIYPGVSVCFKPRVKPRWEEKDEMGRSLGVSCVFVVFCCAKFFMCRMFLVPNFCECFVRVLVVVLPQKFCEFVMCVYRVSVAKIL